MCACFLSMRVFCVRQLATGREEEISQRESIRERSSLDPPSLPTGGGVSIPEASVVIRLEGTKWVGKKKIITGLVAMLVFSLLS